MRAKAIGNAKGVMRAAVAFAAAVVLSMAAFAGAAHAAVGDYNVEYRGQAEGLVAVQGDFFKHFGPLMPGDSVSGAVTVKNNTAIEQEISFQSLGGAAVNAAGQPSDLGRVAQLKVTNVATGSVVYEGSVADAQAQGVSLGKFKQGQSAKLTFELTLPTTVGNAYAGAQGHVTWLFTTADVPGPTPPTPPGPGGGGGGTGGGGEGGGQGGGTGGGQGGQGGAGGDGAGGNGQGGTGNGEGPLDVIFGSLAQTGDAAMISIVIGVVVLAACAFIVLLVARRKMSDRK